MHDGSMERQQLLHYEEILRNAGQFVTVQRRALLKYLLRHRVHPTTAQIATAIGRSGSASLATVYNSLALFAEWEHRGIVVQTLIPGPTRSELDEKGGAYKSALTEERRDPSEVVTASLRHIERGDPLVTTARGTYKQRFFSGMFPARVVVRKVAEMFRPPEQGT